MYTLLGTLIINLFLVTSTGITTFSPDTDPVDTSFNFTYVIFPVALTYFNHNEIQIE